MNKYIIMRKEITMAVKKNTAAKAAKETTEKAVKAAKETTEKAENAVKETKAKAEKAEKAVKASTEKAEKEVKSAVKAAEKEVKSAAKKAVKAKNEVYFEFGGLQFNAADVEKKVRAACGKKASEIKSLKIYVKAEDYAAYYVVNGTESGKIDL